MKFFDFRKKIEKEKRLPIEKTSRQNLGTSTRKKGFLWHEKAVEDFFGFNKRVSQTPQKKFFKASSANQNPTSSQTYQNKVFSEKRKQSEGSNRFFKGKKKIFYSELNQPSIHSSLLLRAKKDLSKEGKTKNFPVSLNNSIKKSVKESMRKNSLLGSGSSVSFLSSRGSKTEAFSKHFLKNNFKKEQIQSFPGKSEVNLKKDLYQNRSFQKEESIKEQKKSFSKKIITKVCNFLISISLFAIVFGVPVFVTGFTLQNPAFEKQIFFYVFLVIGFLGWIFLSIVQEELVLKRTALDFFIVALLFSAILSTFFSVDKWHSFWGFFDDPSRGLIGMFSLAIFCYLVMGTFNKNRSNIFALASFLSSLIVVLWSLGKIFQFDFIFNSFLERLPVSLLGSVNNLTVFLAMTIPINLALFFKISKKISGVAPVSRLFLILILINVALALFVLAVFSSFIPNWTIVLGSGCFLLFALAGVGGMPKRKLVLPMLFFISLIIISQLNGLQLVKKIEVSPEIRPSFESSLEATKKSLSEKPFFGSGPANFGFSFSKYRHAKFNDSNAYNLRFFQGSNLAFEAIFTLGILGTVALFSLLLSYLGTFFFFLIKAAKQDLVLSIGWFSAFVVFMGAVLTTKIEGGLLLFGVISGVIALISLIKEGGVETKIYRISLKISPKYALTFAFLVLTFLVGSIFSLIFVGKIYWADVFAGRIVQAFQQENSLNLKDKIEDTKASLEEENQKRIKYLKKATELNPREGRYWTQLGQEYMNLVNKEYEKGKENRNLELLAEYLQLAAKNAKKGAELMPQDALALQILAQIYENAGIYVADSLNLALEWYEKAADFEPVNPDFVLKIGQIKDAMIGMQNDFQKKKKLLKEAREYFEKSIDLKKNYSPGYYNLALNYEKLGELNNAIETIQKAIQHDASSGVYFYNLARLLQIRGAEEDISFAKEIYEKLAEVNPNDMNVHLGLALAYEYFDEFEKAEQKYDLLLDMIYQVEDEKEQEAVKNKIEELKKNVQEKRKNDLTIISREIKEQQAQISPMKPPEPSFKNEDLPSASPEEQNENTEKNKEENISKEENKKNNEELTPTEPEKEAQEDVE